MRFVVILLVSFVVRSTAETLQVRCGDEKCERPTNQAVTTLRYTPDKPYKVQINAVNSKVDIFGVTDDLYYIRYGRNFGFLPKNHLRESSKGHYPFNVEIDITKYRIDQRVREENFLHKFLESSQSAPLTKQPSDKPLQNETRPAPVHELSEENLPAEPQANEISQKMPSVLPDVVEKDMQKDPSPPVVEESAESENDSGIDEDEDEEDDEEEEEESEEVKTKLPPNAQQEQPELVAIPPGKDTEAKQLKDKPETEPLESVKEEAKVEPVAQPVAASSTVEHPQFPQQVYDDAENATIQENSKTDIVPDFVPLKAEAVNEANTLLQNDTANLLQESNDQQQETVTQQAKKLEVETTIKPHEEEKIEEIIITTPAPIIEEKPDEVAEKKNDHEHDHVHTPELPAPSFQETVHEVILETSTEKIQELPVADDSDQKPVQISDIPVEVEILAPPIGTKMDEERNSKRQSPPPPTIHALPQEVPIGEVPQPELQETFTQKPILKPEPDALLQKFNEKLGNRIVEGTGKGTVEPLHKPDEHHHDHHHHEHHEEKAHLENKLPSSPQAENAETIGFFSGLYKRFFSDEDDSEQHFHDKAQAKNTLAKPSSDRNADSGFCEKIDSENCPQSLKAKGELNFGRLESEWKTADEYLRIMLNEAIEMMDLIISLGLTALTVLIFTLGYYCINKARKEGPLIAKMNELERHLMASEKENELLKGDVIATKQKLMSIEDNSFGSNDMVIALKRDLDMSEQARNELSEKIASLEKELEAAAEDGLELNRMVSELLNNQSGSESIISSVEELQQQLNEQQETIVTMNDTLAAKSRENSELHIQLSEINGKFQGDFQNFQHQLDAIVLERTNLQIELENLKRESDVQVNQLIEERNGEVTRLNSELTSYAKNYDETKKLLNTAESRVQALEECLKAIKKDSKGGEFKDLFDVADLKADLLAVTKEKSTMQEQLQTEKDSRKLLEDRVKLISEEMSNLKKEYGAAEKEKLEAQTRLEVLSTYFKEKETQLQQELSFKEARWMKQQGETTTTVEKVQALNDEIQTLKSQNDSLRAEIEAQVAAHKLNISSLEAQSHAAWLNARQAERKLEESRMESAALRRRLTSIAENPSGASDLMNGLPGLMNETLNSIPSPIRVESPNNANSLPPAPMMMPPFLPQGFLPGAPPPFHLPPGMPPFLPPPGEMGPPLGRLMSPPPKRFTPTMRDDRDRYSPRGRRYSPDSRYDDYTAFETETDYSPPPSPSPPPRRGYNSPADRSKKSKGGHSSTGSIESNPTSRRK